MIIKIIAKMDIPFSLQGIMGGPLSESDFSSLNLCVSGKLAIIQLPEVLVGD